MVLDLHQYNRRQKILRQRIGIPKEDRFLKDSEVYTIYFNPATGIYTGIKDNERNVFYELKNQEDIQKFINSVNVKEKKNSIFVYGIEKTLKEFMDREIEFFEKFREYENKIEKLEEELNTIDECLSSDDVRMLDKLYNIRGFEPL